MGSGNELSLLKINTETITANLQPSRGRLVRGRIYRVTFEEIEAPTVMIHVARLALITFGIVVGIPYVLTLIGMAKIADRHNRRARQ